jgi:hypothetical protein
MFHDVRPQPIAAPPIMHIAYPFGQAPAHAAASCEVELRGEHVPVGTPVLAIEQAWQLAVQVLLQQMPSAEHMPFEHWLLPLHDPPTAFFGMHDDDAQ